MNSLSIHRGVLLLGVAAAIVFVGCTRKPKEPVDQVSYTIGAQFGKSLKAQNLQLNSKVLARGIEDALNGKELELSDSEMQKAMMKLSEERQQDARKEADGNKSKAMDFLTKNKATPGVMVTESGLQFKITEPGNGVKPKLEDVVVVNYKGTLIDGTEFDSSYKRNMPSEFPLNGVIPGWAEGIRLLKKGGKATLWVPPELGYGDRARQQIPANAVLIFDVELLDVKPSKAKAPATTKK